MFIVLSSLKYVPVEENNLDRHDNPETSLRKPVRRIDEHEHAIEYKSITEAVAASDWSKPTIRNKCNSHATTKDGYLWQFIV